ncbi:hypothetical protein L0Z10_29820 (plasmid) [Burkholderia multivorans]|uniref:hypothetical protein n=1 Tax=Burkholderia multivorans TaxID=87883 RepID=UPI00207CF01F|nr:hypothetical protein [Burkholderia multivorans]MCO1459938.1 hypothetical protein [Burkholderia multivorans]
MENYSDEIATAVDDGAGRTIRLAVVDSFLQSNEVDRAGKAAFCEAAGYEPVLHRRLSARDDDERVSIASLCLKKSRQTRWSGNPEWGEIHLLESSGAFSLEQLQRVVRSEGDPDGCVRAWISLRTSRRRRSPA